MKIKILYTQETIGSGGVEQRRLNLIKYLNKDLYEIKVVCTKTEGALADEMRAAGAEVIEVGPLTKIWELERYKAVLQVIKNFKPHIIHGAVFEGVLLATIAGYLGRVPIIIAEETSDPQNRTAKASLLLRIITSVADKVVAIAPKVGDYLKNVAKISSSKIKVITNGVDTPRTVSLSEVDALKKSLGVTPSNIIVGSVGRVFNDHKRFTDILKAVSLLNQKKDLKILIVGDGRDKELIQLEADKLGLADNLIMAGYQADTAPYYKIMDIFCLASQREGFGLVAAEAMFHELPVIATRVGGLQDVVLENITGILVDAKKPEQIAAAIEKLLSERDLMRHMGSNGKIRAEQEFGAERYVKEVEKMYEGLLKQKQLI